MLPFTLLLPATTAAELTEGRELAECWAEHAAETGLTPWSSPAGDPSPRVHSLCRLCYTLTGWNLLEFLGFSVGEEKKCMVLDTRFFSWQSEVRFQRVWSCKPADCCCSGVSESSFRQVQTVASCTSLHLWCLWTVDIKQHWNELFSDQWETGGRHIEGGRCKTSKALENKILFQVVLSLSSSHRTKHCSSCCPLSINNQYIKIGRLI